MLRSAGVAIVLCVLLVDTVSAAEWGCYGTKPGHPTAAEREAFIREVSALAIKAEAAHGVPASVLAAMAIAESGYGWTRLAIDANNLFAWKYVRSAAGGRKSYVNACQRARIRRDRFLVFANRADAVNFVAARLATAGAYRERTEAYKAARKRGADADAAAKAWLHGVARRYSGKPDEFVTKITRIMNNPAAPSDIVEPGANLYRLSGAGG